MYHQRFLQVNLIATKSPCLLSISLTYDKFRQQLHWYTAFHFFIIPNTHTGTCSLLRTYTTSQQVPWQQLRQDTLKMTGEIPLKCSNTRTKFMYHIYKYIDTSRLVPLLQQKQLFSIVGRVNIFFLIFCNAPNPQINQHYVLG